MLAVARALVVAGCASNDTSRVTDAVTSPLHDLNLVQAEIPPKLQEVEKAPYAVPADRSCALLAQEIRELDAVLGTDLDAPPSESNCNLHRSKFS